MNIESTYRYSTGQLSKVSLIFKLKKKIIISFKLIKEDITYFINYLGRIAASGHLFDLSWASHHLVWKPLYMKIMSRWSLTLCIVPLMYSM